MSKLVTRLSAMEWVSPIISKQLCDQEKVNHDNSRTRWETVPHGHSCLVIRWASSNDLNFGAKELLPLRVEYYFSNYRFFLDRLENTLSRLPVFENGPGGSWDINNLSEWDFSVTSCLNKLFPHRFISS